MQPRDRLFLIVDDEPDACWALERILEKEHGTRCRRAATAAAAIAQVRRCCFALALLDAKLPDMDGLDLASRIRHIDAGLPIIVVSGYFYQHDLAIQMARKTGLIHSFVGKPFAHGEILRAVAEALEGRGEAGGILG